MFHPYKHLLHLNGPLFEHSFNAYSRVKGLNLRIVARRPGYILTELNSRQCIQVLEKSRLSWYFGGIRNRLNSLGAQYFLDRIRFSREDTFVDCGANIGELGLYFRGNGVDINYIGFEPSEDEFYCCQYNNSDAQIFRCGLLDMTGTTEFFVKSDTADSSVFPMRHFRKRQTISVCRLDDVFGDLGVRFIKCLKVEAEGAEPEVLVGAQATLPKVAYVAVDAGPERGVTQENTVVQVLDIMRDSGFSLRHFGPERLTMLFENMRLVS